MRRGRVIGLGVVLWLAAELPAQAVVLRYTPKLGRTSIYVVTSSAVYEGAAEGGSSLEPVQTESTEKVVQKVLAQTEKGVKVQVRFAGGTETSSRAGEQTSGKIPAERYVVIVDARGGVVEVVEHEGGEGQEEGVPTAKPTEAWGLYGRLPEGDVGPGAMWSDEYALFAESGFLVKVNSRLLELVTYQGRKCAKIRTTFSSPMDVDLGGMPGGSGEGTTEASLKGSVQGHLVWYYDYENSVSVATESQITTRAAGDLLAEGEPVGAVTLKITEKGKMGLVK